MKKVLYATILSGFIWGCGSEQADSNIDDLESIEDSIQTASQSTQATTNFSEEEKLVINQIFNSIPSPLEMSFLIKKIGSEYDLQYLNASENVEKYADSYKKALNLGVYGSDLAYTNIYKQNQDGLAYLGNVRGLAKDLSIDQFFDSDVLTNLIKNSENLDSLLIITTSNFEKINLHLQSQKREHLSALLLTGGWIEGLSLACHVYQDKPNGELKDKIGEQKSGLEQLLQLLKYYEQDPKIQPLIEGLVELKSEFDERVKIEIIEGEPELVEQDGLMMVIDNSETVINFSEEDLKFITEKVQKIRNEIIQ